MKNVYVIFAFLLVIIFHHKGIAQDSTRTLLKGGFELFKSGLTTVEIEQNLWDKLSVTLSAGGFLSLYRKPGQADHYHVMLESRYYWLLNKRGNTEGIYAGLTGGYEYFWERKPRGLSRTFYHFVEFGGVLGGQYYFTPRFSSDINVYYGWVPAQNGLFQDRDFHNPKDNQGQRVGVSIMLGYAF